MSWSGIGAVVRFTQLNTWTATMVDDISRVSGRPEDLDFGSIGIEEGREYVRLSRGRRCFKFNNQPGRYRKLSGAARLRSQLWLLTSSPEKVDNDLSLRTVRLAPTFGKVLGPT